MKGDVYNHKKCLAALAKYVGRFHERLSVRQSIKTFSQIEFIFLLLNSTTQIGAEITDVLL
jgi:hypothetical protein